MIPSPVNLSTVPSKRSTASVRIEKKRCMILRHSSGSCCSARSIDPFTSANSTVTCLRSASSLPISGTTLIRLRGMPSVLVTGASTGIGLATALRLDAAGWTVFAGVRRDADAERLRADASTRLTPLALDVTDPAQIEVAAERIASATGAAGLSGLVNNAGVSLPSPLETMPIDDFRRQLEVNLTGQVAVTQAVLSAIRSGRGRIVFISSIGGLIAFPMTGAYHAAKFGIEAVGDTFR